MSNVFEEWEGKALTSILNIWYWTSMYNCKFAHWTFRFRLSPSPPAALCDTSAQTSWGPRSSQSPPTPFPFQFVMSSSAEAKILRFTIPISEREPLRLARATQNSLRAFGCQLNGSCGSSTCPWTFILTVDLQFEDLNSSHHIFLQMGSILWDDWNSEYITIFCPEVAKEDFLPNSSWRRLLGRSSHAACLHWAC